MREETLVFFTLPIASAIYPDERKDYFELAARFEKDGNTFIALVPYKKRASGEEKVEVLAFKVIKSAEGNNMLGDIKDEDEWNFVKSEWMKLIGKMKAADYSLIQ